MSNTKLGFEFIDNESYIIAGFHKVSLSIIFTKDEEGIESELNVSITGLNLELDESVEWLNKNIKIGDEFIIKVKETDSISPYRVKEKPLPYAEVLAKMSEEEILAMKFKQFKYLEKKLKSKGLI